MKYNLLLSDYCRWNDFKEVSRLLKDHSDLDLTLEDGICFSFAIKHNNIEMLTALLDYYTKTKLQAADQDTIEYKLANFKLRNILEDALKAFEVSAEMQKILDPYTSSGEDTIEEALSSFDEAEFTNEAFPNEGSSTAATVQYDGGELTEELLSFWTKLSVAHRNLYEQYKSIVNMLKEITNDEAVQDSKGQEIIKDLVGMKKILAKLKPSLVEKVKNLNPEDTSSEAHNLRLLNRLVERFNSDLVQAIKEITLECIKRDHDPILFQLIEGEDVDRMIDGRSLLIHATSQAIPPNKVINGLLARGANPFIKCRFNETAFSKAVNYENLELAKTYFHHQAEPKLGLNLALSAAEQRLEQASTPKAFYEELARDLQDANITKSLGFDLDSVQSCLITVNLAYEALGLDADLLYKAEQ